MVTLGAEIGKVGIKVACRACAWHAQGKHSPPNKEADDKVKARQVETRSNAHLCGVDVQRFIYNVDVASLD